ncbi:MAG: twin-arginine translocase TatA/TatE family subunit, partial [Poseidonia sp.]
MVGGLGPLELTSLLGLFFILFGANKLPEMANALGRSKGEFQ